MNLPFNLTSYLDSRAEPYGGDFSDMLAVTPEELDDPHEIKEFWEQRDLSHVISQHNCPELTDDWSNIIPEAADLNRSRGADNMSPDEIQAALLDNQLLAEELNHC